MIIQIQTHSHSNKNLQRNTEELGSYQKKIIRIDNHLGVSLAGLAPDARILSNFLRQQSMSSKLVYNRPLAVSRAVHSIADKAQTNTQQYGRRPYGVGLIIIGHDESGPHLYEFLPSGSVLEYVGTAIGARSQAARTYLERTFQEFADCSLEELIVHGLNALRDTLAQDKELTLKNTSISFVGVDTPFKILDEDLVVPWLDKLDSVSRSSGANPTTTADETTEPTETTESTEQATDAPQDSMDTTE